MPMLIVSFNNSRHLYCALNRLLIAMYYFIIYLLKCLSLIFQTLVVECIQKLAFDRYIILFFRNMHQRSMFNCLLNIFHFFSIKNIGLYPFLFNSDIYYGGGNVTRTVSPVLLKSRLIHHDQYGCLNPLVQYRFVKYFLHIDLANRATNNNRYLLCRFTLSEVFNWLSIHDIRIVAQKHGITLSTKENRSQISEVLVNHVCDSCSYHVCIFEETFNKIHMEKDKKPSYFPPPPLSNKLAEKIINGFCADTDPKILQETGCAVCGSLCRVSDLSPLDNYKDLLKILVVKGVTRQERRSVLDSIDDINGPVLDNKCTHICSSCAKAIQQHVIPLNALANGLWIGDIPPQLQKLSFAERMMIARIRHNRCLVRVSSGRAKMTANVIMYSNPTLKVYHSLPPSKKEMNEVLAFVFTGPSQPTDEDFNRCPMLVRRQKVQEALEWLKLNHRDYEDLDISQKNLASYPLAGIPVTIDYRRIESNSNRIPAMMSIHDDEDDEEGSTDGPCSFTVHGLSGVDYGKMTIQALKARALQHLESEGKMLGIGHDSVPQSIYNNSQAYPQMFPWLFPYGFGGIGQTFLKKKISELEHKRQLLMYHDKRFQCDLYFPIIAFNHEQLKGGITGSFLVVKRGNFANISRRLLSLDKSVLKNVTDRLVKGEHVKPTTDQEKTCFSILDDLDHIGGHVKGSITSKKYMRNEIWSLLAFRGAPSWFITLSPADNRHPISLYYASENITFKPETLTSSERNRLTSSNPIAAARFFHLIVELFIKHVLGVDNHTPGIYGETSAYYGTVEQQGRLTLHLHLLLWIKNAISPQEIRNRLINKDSAFQRDLITYLESVHRGEFITGTMQDLKEKIPRFQESNAGIHSMLINEDLPINTQISYEDPTLTMPDPVPLSCGVCEDQEKFCNLCIMNQDWWDRFKLTVDDIILRSNVHRCTTGVDITPKQNKKKSESASQKNVPKGCLDQYGNCKARFPRNIYEETIVDSNDGHIFMKKLESMLNTFTPVLSYLTRSNTDVTSLLSGTSIKAIVSYISDYISKPALKTYQIFSSMYDVFENTDKEINIKGDNTRRLLLKIVNSLSSKMEIGSPMASMYLLGNPDHYTSHKFIPFWWKNYVNDVQLHWKTITNEKMKMNESENAMNVDEQKDDVSKLDTTNIDMLEDKVILNKKEGTYVGSNNVDDYKYRPQIYGNVSLFEWVQAAVRRKRTKKEMEKVTYNHQITDFTPLIEPNSVKIDDDNICVSDVDVYENEDMQYKYVHRNRYVPFLDEHPLSSTHVVKCDFERTQTMIPNFVGSPLPRFDQGDKENYCCTMLTLFKPWRTGSDLKIDGQSWNHAYENYKFSNRHKDLMKNFNLRYECLDARDDFHAEFQKKQNESRKRGPQVDQDDDDEFEDEVPDNFDYQFSNNENQELDIPGPAYYREIHNKHEADDIMSSSGWLDKPSYIQNHSFEWFSPNIGLTHTAWASCIKNERDKLFKNKIKSYIPSNEITDKSSVIKNNDVRILSADYLLKTYRAKNNLHQNIVDNLIHNFSLNEEQERAFRIIANHASSLAPEPLKLYLGGMGGTGKSQVIKAVIDLFNKREESYRFIVLAPTGTAAALLNGSTYHRVLGIYSRSEKGVDYSRSEGTVINEVRTRLQGVEYIFIDEISMLSCRDLFAISQRLSQVFNKDTLFGAVNMILAGDFAQLPPVSEQPFYSERVCNKQDSAMKPRQQEATLGKIFWHQFTTVVILKQNMRQTAQSKEDTKLRTALENMRYAACTQEDIAFLNTLVAKKSQKDTAIFTDPEFRNVSVITAWNNQKDQFNERGSARFAADNKQQLTNFYSIDSLGPQDENGRTKNKKRTRRKRSHTMSAKLQEALWDRTPSSSEHVPSKLSLCVGMPVMIRNNDATELCITKGQEAIVVGWDSFIGPFEKPVLNTLFVKLLRPPQEVNLPGLPTNIVPLTRTSTRITCTLKSGIKIIVQRQQILVLPNFAMTDYTSQGKTRDKNVIDLSRCRNHLSYYTCLSRSSNAKGTILLTEPDANKITKGISGYLRQEFRELHILDEVTKLNYHAQLPDGILHSLRNPTIRSYVLWNSSASNEKSWHPALLYKDHENRLKEPQNDDTWITSKNKKKHIKPTENKTKIPLNKMRRLADCQNVIPKGIIWDPVNYSCAYDSLFTILYNIWERNPKLWQRRLKDIHCNLDLLCTGFERTLKKESTLEAARNRVRSTMTHENPAYFPTGIAMTSISHVVDAIIPTRTCGVLSLQCENCHYQQASPLLHFGEYIELTSTGRFFDDSENMSLLSDILGWQLNNRQRRSQVNCPECILQQQLSKMCLTIDFERIPYLMVIGFSAPRYMIDWNLDYNINDILFQFRLAGVVYGGQNHFVCRIVDDRGMIWYHDGIATGSGCLREGQLADIAEQTSYLQTTDYDGQLKDALYAIYIRD